MSVALSYGTHSLSATQTTNSETGAASNTVSGIVRPAAPAISSPADGSTTTSPSTAVAGTGVASAILTLYDSGTPIGTATVTPSGTWSMNVTLAYGAHSLAAAQTLNGETSVLSNTVGLRVIDTPPTLHLPPNITLNAASSAGAVATWVATATDNKDGTDPVICTPTSGATFPIGTTTVNCTATNSSGMTTSGSFTVKVNDTDLALGPVPASVSVIATSAAGAVVTYTAPSAVDEEVAAASCAPASGSTFPIGTTTVLCTATSADDSPPTMTKTFIITVQHDLQLTLSITPSTAVNGTTVTASASLTNAASVSRKVTLVATFSYVSPSGQTFTVTTSSETITTRAGQTIARSFTFVVTKDLPRGMYSATVTATDVTGSVTSTATFVVK